MAAEDSEGIESFTAKPVREFNSYSAKTERFQSVSELEEQLAKPQA